MKKLALHSLIFSSLLFTTLSFANVGVNNYSSSLHPKANIAANLTLHPTTDISIINASSSFIYAVVPGAINDVVNPGTNDHIWGHDNNIWNTYIVLKDPNYNTFYTANACRLAIITVYGGPGSYRINTDSDLCN